MSRAALCVLAFCGASAVVIAASAQDQTRADAASMTKKLTAIIARGAVPTKSTSTIRTSFTDRELNAYFKVTGPEIMPVGLATPEFAIDAGGKVVAKSIVDLTAVRNAKPRAWNDPINLMGGSLEVMIAGILQAANGRGTLAIENATLGGVPIPTSLLQELVKHYSRTADSPGGFDLSKPFELPANIRTIETARGGATIFQATPTPTK